MSGADSLRAASDIKLERETVLQWNLEKDEVTAWTADPSEVTRWKRVGWPVEVFGTVKGKPHSWQARVPRHCVTYRKVKRRVATEKQRLAGVRSAERRKEGRTQHKS